MIELIDKLKLEKTLSDSELKLLIETRDNALSDYLRETARRVANERYGNKIFIRGLIEISSFCKNDCYYCGIRRSNKNAERYRLSKEDILLCCEEGYRLGFRTFVMQGGEDMFFTDDILCDIVSSVKEKYPDCAVTLSVGERSRESYQRLYDAGADRYLLRHETAEEGHYGRLHPRELSLKNRMKCLWDLKEIGFQTGTGFMVGSPYQKTENLIADLRFIEKLRPQMIGIGPFIPHHDTDFSGFEGGSKELTLRLIAILRLMNPNALIPATTALGTISKDGREQGVLSGANVIMPNLSPISVRKKYMLYDNKLSSGEEASEGLNLLRAQMNKIGYEVVVDRGDYRGEDED